MLVLWIGCKYRVWRSIQSTLKVSALITLYRPIISNISLIAAITITSFQPVTLQWPFPQTNPKHTHAPQTASTASTIGYCRTHALFPRKLAQWAHPHALWGIITNHRSLASIAGSYWTLQPQGTPLVRAAIFGAELGPISGEHGVMVWRRFPKLHFTRGCWANRRAEVSMGYR